MTEIPRPAIVYGEVATKLLDMGERDKAYELFTLAGVFALNKTVEYSAPIKDTE